MAAVGGGAPREESAGGCQCGVTAVPREVLTIARVLLYLARTSPGTQVCFLLSWLLRLGSLSPASHEGPVSDGICFNRRLFGRFELAFEMVIFFFPVEYIYCPLPNDVFPRLGLVVVEEYCEVLRALRGNISKS